MLNFFRSKCYMFFAFCKMRHLCFSSAWSQKQTISHQYPAVLYVLNDVNTADPVAIVPPFCIFAQEGIIVTVFLFLFLKKEFVSNRHWFWTNKWSFLKWRNNCSDQALHLGPVTEKAFVDGVQLPPVLTYHTILSRHKS